MCDGFMLVLFRNSIVLVCSIMVCMDVILELFISSCFVFNYYSNNCFLFESFVNFFFYLDIDFKRVVLIVIFILVLCYYVYISISWYCEVDFYMFGMIWMINLLIVWGCYGYMN